MLTRDNRIHRGKTHNCSFPLLFPAGSKIDLAASFPWWKQKLLEALMKTSPPPWHAHTPIHSNTHIHTHTNSRGKCLAACVIYGSIFQSSCVFPSQRSHACVDVHSPPPTPQLRCIIVQWEAGETWARSTIPPIRTLGVVTSQPWLHYPDLDVWGGLCLLWDWSNLPWDKPVQGITVHVLDNPFGFAVYLDF